MSSSDTVHNRCAATGSCAAVEALSNANGFELDEDDRRLMDETVPAARKASGDRFEDAWATGEELELPAAVEPARQALE